MPSNHLIFSCSFLLPPSVFPSINQSVLRIRWSKYWSFSFSIQYNKPYNKRVLRSASSQVTMRQFLSVSVPCLNICLGNIIRIKMKQTDPKCFGRRMLKFCVGCVRMGVFIYKTLLQCILQEAHLISYQPHFCSWFCSQRTVLPFRCSFWMNMMTMLISSRMLLTSTAKKNPNTFFTFCNNRSINDDGLFRKLRSLYSAQVTFLHVICLFRSSLWKWVLHTSDTEILILFTQSVILTSPLDASIKGWVSPFTGVPHTAVLSVCAGAMAADYLIARWGR